MGQKLAAAPRYEDKTPSPRCFHPPLPGSLLLHRGLTEHVCVCVCDKIRRRKGRHDLQHESRLLHTPVLINTSCIGSADSPGFRVPIDRRHSRLTVCSPPASCLHVARYTQLDQNGAMIWTTPLGRCFNAISPHLDDIHVNEIHV